MFHGISHSPRSIEENVEFSNFPKTSEAPKLPRIKVSISEMLAVTAIVSTSWVILLLAANVARDIPRPGIHDRLPPLLPQLKPLYDCNPWLVVI